LFLVFLKGYSQNTTSSILPDSIYVCKGDSFLLKIQDNKYSSKANVQWTTDYSIIFNTKQLYIKQKGRYIVKINDNNKTFHDTAFVRIIDKPKININDTFLCTGNSIKYVLKNKSYKYNWSTGESGNSITIDKAGKYWVTANYKGCSFTDTFKVKNALGVVPNFGKEVVFCESEPNKLLSIKNLNDSKLFWSTGSNSNSINISKEGWHWVKSVSKFCGTKTDSVFVKFKNCDCEIFIPNSFTPNDDDKNDFFAPSFQCEYSYFSLTIFDRWGNTVYYSSNSNGKWDGKFKGNICPDDVYVYKLEAVQKSNDKKIVRNGHISLFR
jgi:gliding motility-associated-like protein